MVAAMMLSGTIGYFVIESGQSFWNVVFFRCLIGSLFLAAYVAATKQFRKEMITVSVLGVIIAGGVTLVGNWVLLFASFDYIPFSIATIAYHMQPMMLVLVSALLTRQLPGFNTMLGLIVAMIGLGLVVGIPLDDIWAVIRGESKADGAVWGLLLALGAAFLYTITTLLTKQVSHVPASVIAVIQVFLGGLFLLPWVNFEQLPIEASSWGCLLFLGLVNTGFMYVIMYDAFQRLSTSLIAILSFIYPVTALFVDYLAFDHTITVLQGVGVILILLAICAVKFNWNMSFRVRDRLSHQRP
ncbi:DMT family transporter [Photobacterium sp. MCCC 1A19761]|uniref:DMT family transporter n=1 Tax=Photobacterium sp. MCCC 1A19761 TaxID=3115000 RepID=UPI00307FAFA9